MALIVSVYAQTRSDQRLVPCHRRPTPRTLVPKDAERHWDINLILFPNSIKQALANKNPLQFNHSDAAVTLKFDQGHQKLQESEIKLNGAHMQDLKNSLQQSSLRKSQHYKCLLNSVTHKFSPSRNANHTQETQVYARPCSCIM